MTGSEIYLIMATIFSGFAAIIAFITVAMCRFGYQKELTEALDDIEKLEKEVKALKLLIRVQVKKESK